MATTDTPTTTGSPATTSYPRTIVRIARGGISGGAILTGVVVTFGAMSLLTSMLAGVIVALGLPGNNEFPGTTVQGGLVTGVLFVLIQFLSYLWGGYTAGRMSRGAGLANGLLVPLVAILVLLLVGAIVATLTTAPIPLPSFGQVSVNDANLQWGVAFVIASVVAVFGGGGLGGLLGMRWHSRLERDAVGDGTPPTET